MNQYTYGFIRFMWHYQSLSNIHQPSLTNHNINFQTRWENLNYPILRIWCPHIKRLHNVWMGISLLLAFWNEKKRPYLFWTSRIKWYLRMGKLLMWLWWYDISCFWKVTKCEMIITRCFSKLQTSYNPKNIDNKNVQGKRYDGQTKVIFFDCQASWDNVMDMCIYCIHISIIYCIYIYKSIQQI